MEGAGEGMVAIVQALQDAGLSVTLTNPAVGHEHVRRSQAYSGMSNVLKWNGHVSRAMNSQTEGLRQCQAHGGSGVRNGMNNSYQLPHGSKSTGSPLNRHLDAPPYSFRQRSNENRFVAKRSMDIVTQTPAREALSTRSSVYWSQRAMPSARSSRAMDAFADSLRKYPSISPERSPSADIIQRLIHYTQSKNLTKSSCLSKSLRSLRNIEASNDSNISKKKSTKNIQTYTRSLSPARDTSPCSHELRFNDRRRSLHSPRSDAVSPTAGQKCRDNALSATYDYLKGIYPRLSPPRGTEVRYLEDVTKYVKDTLKQICDEQTTTCPKIASRYHQHKRECPKKSGLSSSESVNKQIQTSETRSREASTVTQGEESNSILRPQACNSCHRPPSFSKRSSIRKIRFSATDPCPRYIVREVAPKPECPENDPCPCPDPEVKFKNKLKQHVLEWLKEIPVSIEFCSLDKKERTKIVMDLVDKLMALRRVDNCEDRMRKYILDCLESLPMWLPSGKRAQEVFKNELADDLINNKLLDLFITRDTFDETIAKWVEGLNFDDDREPVNKGKFVQNFIKRLKPLNQYRTDNDSFRDDLKEIILDMLEKLPLQIEGSNIKYYNEKADILANELAGLPKIETDEKDLYNKKLINHLLKNVDEAKGLKPSEWKRIVEQLSGNVKDLITRDINDDDRQEIIRKVVNDWIRSTHADPDDLITYLRKKILDWLQNKPEFSGDSLPIVQDNEKLSRDLAKKFNNVLPEFLEDDNIKNKLLEDINDQLKNTLEMRGDQIEPKTTKKLAKDLLNYLVDTVKELQKDTLEKDLIKIVQDELKTTPQLSGDTPSSKRDNDNLSKDIAKKFLQLPSKNLDNKDVKDNLTEDINDQLNGALDKRSQRKAPKAMKKLSENLFDKLKQAILNEKGGNLLENALRKKIRESLNEVPELAGVNSATKRANDEFSKDLATKMLEVPPEYIDNEDIKDNLLETINNQLNEALENRGQRIDSKETKELAKDMLSKSVDAIKRENGSRRYSSSLVSDPLEKKLRMKVLEYLNDVPYLSGYTPSNKMYNDKVSKAIAKKTKDLLPQLLENDIVKNQLLEDINDQLEDTLEDREIDKSPKTTKKLAKDLLNYLVDTVKESPKDTLEKDLIKIVQDELKTTPQLSGDTPSSKRDNDNLSKDIAKKFLQVPSKNLDNKDVKDNLTGDINDELNEALDKRGQREAPQAMKKSADNLFDKLKNAIQNEKGGNLLENDLRKKILESLNEVPELAGVSSATKRANDEFSKDLATKIVEDPPEYIDNKDVKENLLEDINDQLYEALEKRGQHKDPKETKELAKDMLNKSVDANKRGKGSRRDSSSLVSDPLENKLRNKVLEYLNDVPYLSGYTPSNKMYNVKVSKAIAKKTKDLLPQLLDDDDVKSQLLKDINDKLEDSLEDKGIDKSSKTTKKLAEDLLNCLVDTVNESQNDTLEKDLIKIVQDELEKTPQLSGDTPSSKRDNINLSKDIAKNFLQVPSKNLNNEDVKDNLIDDINDQLNEALDKRGQREAPKAMKKSADNLFDKLKNSIQNEKGGNLLENDLRKKILESLNEVPELVGVSPATKHANDEFSKDLATKMLDVPPEYFNNEDMKDNLLEDINDQLNEALEKRGQCMDPKATKKLAKNMLNKLVDTIERANRSRKDSSSLVLGSLDDDQLKNTLDDRGIDKSPKIKKIANDLRNNLANTVKESQEGIVSNLEKDLRKIVLVELENTPQLSGDTPSSKRDNDNLSKYIAKNFLQISPVNLDNDDLKYNLIKNINDQLNEALEKRGERKAPKAMKKLADKLFDMLKNTINKEKEIDPLENILRRKILESLKDVPELASESFGTLRDNDKFSLDLAKKIIKVSPEDIDNTDVKENLLEYINDELNEALRKRRQYKDPEETKELAKDILNNLLHAIQKGRKDVSAEPTYLRNRIGSWYKDIPELLVGDIAENKKSVEKFADNLQKIRDEGGKNRQIEDEIEKWLDDTSKKKRVKFSEKEKDKLKNKIFNSIKAKSTRSHDEPEESKRIVWNWFNNIPEIAVGDPSANKELSDRLADKIISLKDEGGDTNQKMQDAIDNWLHTTSNKKGVHFNNPQRAKMRRNLMDSLKAALTPSSSLKDDDEKKRKVWNWFKDIPILSDGDNDENKKLVQGLANKLIKIQDDGKDEKCRQKIKYATDDWLEDKFNEKGVILNQKQKEKLINKLADVFKSMPLQKSQSISVNEDEEPGGPLWDWFKDIPELSGDKFENKLNVDALDKKLKKLGDRSLDTDAAEEIEDAIEDWLEDRADKKNVKLYSKQRKQLRKKLMDTLYPNYSSRRTSYSDEDITQKVWEWFTNIPEISGGDLIKNKKLVKKLDEKLKKIHNENLDDEVAKHKMQGNIDNWLQDVALIKGEKLNTRIQEELRNKLMISLLTRAIGKRKKSRSSSHDFERFHNEPQIRDWFNNIPKLSNGKKSNDKKHVDGLIKRVKNIENADVDKEQNNIKLIRSIDSWLRGMAKKKDVKLNKKEIESHRNNLINALKPKRANIKIYRAFDVEGQKTEKQKVQEWFENNSKLNDGNDVENKKLIDDMAKTIENIHEKNDGNRKIANEIKDEVDRWIKTVSTKKKVRLSLEEVEALKKTLLDSITNKPSLSISDETNSDTLDKITNSESLESDKDTDESNSTSNKPKNKTTEKIINKLKAYKSALKRFKDVSPDVDEDRRKISEWLKNVPETKFGDESESILIDKYTTKLKKLRIGGKLNNKKKMNEEVKNWLDDIYKKDGSKLDNITKENLIKSLVDSVNSKESKNRNGTLSSDQSVDDNVKKIKQRASRSPEKTSPTTYYSYKGPEDQNDLDSDILKKEIDTKNPDGDSESARSSSSYSKDRKHWNKEPDVRFSDHDNNGDSPTRSIEFSLKKYDTDSIMSEDEDTASYESPTLSIKTPELGSPNFASRGTRGSQLDGKSSPTKPTPEKDLRQLIIGAGIEPKIMPKSKPKPNPHKRKQNPTIKERQKSKGSILSISPKRQSSILTDTRHSDIPLTISETLLRQNPRLRAKNDVASRKLIEKAIMKPESQIGKKKSPSMSNNSNKPGIYYVEDSDSNEQRLRRSSIATQKPIQKSSKKSGEGEDSTKTSIKFNKLTKAKISEFLAKNVETITSPNYADVEKDIILILTEDADLPPNEIRALARMIIKRTRRINGIEDSNYDKEDDVNLYELDSDSDNDYDSTDKIPGMMSRARHLVRSVFDETYDFEVDPETEIQLEDAIVHLIGDQLAQGDIDDPTKDALLKLLHDANVPEHIADDICDKVMRRARERPMSFSEYRPYSPRNRIESALTHNQKLSFLENARREIADFYDELTDSVSAGSREIINEAIKDTVAKLADILDDPELTGEQKEDMMKNEIIRYLRKLPIQGNVPEEDLANQLMDRVQNIKFTSSTPEHSEVKSFHPRRENLDTSLSTIFDENDLEANEIRFKDQIVDAIQNWSGNIDAIKEKVGFRDTMANDLANEIIDRQKYLQVNPHAKSSSEEELEHAKYIVFKWLNRMVNLDDFADSGTQIGNLVNAFSSIPVPKMAEQLKKTSLWALSGTSHGNFKSYEDPLESDIAGWLQSVPINEYARDDPYIQEEQIKQFVATMKKHKDKPNVEELAEQEINKWLQAMVNADQHRIETMGNRLKNILKKNGYVNPPQGPATSQNKNTTPKQPAKPKVTLQEQLPAKSTMPSQRPEMQSKQPPPSKALQQHGISPQQTVQSQPFSVSRTPPSLIPPQDYQYIVGNHQNQQSLLNLDLIPDTDKNNNKDTDRARPKFKKPVDVLYDVVDKWCKDLPIYSENPKEDPEKTGALKQNIASKLIYKLGELNMNPEILNDDFLYEDLILDEVDRHLKDVPKNSELDKYLPALKMELAAKIKDARQKIRNDLAGQAYKQQLRDTMSTSICLPDNLSPDEQASFDILKDNLADAFINLHYVPDNPEDAKKFKTKINDEINRFCDEFLRHHPRLPVDRRKLTRDLYAALLSVPVPRDESMIHEVEQSRIKEIIDDWMKELPHRDETLTEQLHRNKTASLLAKRLHELEKEKASNPDLENEMFEEISKWLRKRHLRPGQEVYVPEFADRLKNKLKSTEHSRRFDLSASPLHQTQSKPGVVCMGRIPPCTLSSEDRSHLKKIRERHGSPCSQDDIVCPREDSFVQGRPISPCSQDVIAYPRINSYSQTAVKPKFSDRGSWCRKEFCPGKTHTPTQTPGSFCSMRRQCDASCMTPTQSPYEILSPHVIINEYYWDTTDGSKQTSFQQTRPPVQQTQGSHTSEYKTPQQSYHAPPPTDCQTPRQSFPLQAPQNDVPPGPHYKTPQPSTSSAYQQPSCECYQPTNEEIPCIPTPSRYNKRHRRCFRSPDASSGDENCPEPGSSRCRRVRVTRLGSLDDTSCQRKRKPEQRKSRSRICDDDSEWSSVRFPEDGEFWECPRYNLYGARGPFIQEKEKREEKFKCKCKERVLTSCRGGNGRSYREYNTRHCDVNCPHPSYMYFR